MYCVETHQLSYSFQTNDTVLKNINLQVPTGSIYGFLGPNGAGKTTTLRLLLGLLKKQQGDIFVFNKQLHKHRISVLSNIGSLIESPSLYGHLTATENLQLLQKLYQCPVIRINEVLHTVGLSGTGKKKISQFSLGMKQRLSIAMALLHQPKLLILDEPTNGLDPNGIIEIRDLLKKLNVEKGISIIISSHLLAEIEKLVTHVGIISKGNMVFQGTLKELNNKQYQTSRLIIETSDIERSKEIIRRMDLDGNYDKQKIILPIPSKETIASLNRKLIQENIDVYEMSVVKKDLETIFMELVNQ
ncbi:MAG: ABC transporter ATP-binding protein [Ferruginibacter sp.]